MTPEEARRLLDGTTPGPWEWADGKDDSVEYEALRGHGGVNALRTEDAELYASWVCGTNADKALAAAAPTLAAMVAGMRKEWGIVAVYLGRHEVERWGFDTRDDAVDEALALDLDEFRIVPRYVTTPEEA